MRFIVLFRIWDQLCLCKVLYAILPLEVELLRGPVELVLPLPLVLEDLELIVGHESL